MPLLNGESGSIDEMKNKAHELGLVMSDEMIDKKLPLRVDCIHRLEFGEVSGHRGLIKRGPGNRGPTECACQQHCYTFLLHKYYFLPISPDNFLSSFFFDDFFSALSYLR